MVPGVPGETGDQAAERELKTLCRALDLVVEGEARRAADILPQRAKAVEAALHDDNWLKEFRGSDGCSRAGVGVKGPEDGVGPGQRPLGRKEASHLLSRSLLRGEKGKERRRKVSRKRAQLGRPPSERSSARPHKRDDGEEGEASRRRRPWRWTRSSPTTRPETTPPEEWDDEVFEALGP